MSNLLLISMHKILNSFKSATFIVFVLLLTQTLQVNAQWISKKTDNGFDEPFYYAYVNSTDQNNYLRLERYNDGFEEGIVFFVGGEYYCSDEMVFIELSFQVNGINKKYSRSCIIHASENPIAVISTEINKEDFLKDFKSCTTMKIRITDNDCETSPQVIYTYNMSGSTAALNFVNTP
jgi:hypothetical protein